MSEFASELEQYDEEWEATKVRAGGQVLDAGVYQAKVAVSRVERSSWGSLQLQLTFEDLGGKGIVTVWDNLDEEVGRSIAKSHVTALGWDGVALSALPAACAGGFFDDLVCEIRVRDNQKDDKIYKAVYVNKLFGKTAVSPDAVDDDIPF